MARKLINRVKALFKTPPKTLEPTIAPAPAAARIGLAIQNREAFLVSRLGWEEARALAGISADGIQVEAIMERLWRHAGVFPADDEQLRAFGEEYFQALGEIDLLGLMNSPHEFSLVQKYGKNPLCCELGILEPYFNDEPWSAQLAGLRVLVIHPFVESIRQQYQTVRARIFNDPRVLPEFDLILLKPPQTIAGNTDGFASWTAALDHLKQQVANQQFDVAIVGCGAYGLPIGAFIKQMGKTCVHLGGATQLLFGITGTRWREHPAFGKLMTGAWRSPLESERPSGWQKVEKGCYW